LNIKIVPGKSVHYSKTVKIVPGKFRHYSKTVKYVPGKSGHYSKTVKYVPGKSRHHSKTEKIVPGKSGHHSKNIKSFAPTKYFSSTALIVIFTKKKRKFFGGYTKTFFTFAVYFLNIITNKFILIFMEDLKILKISLILLRNEVHYQFFESLIAILLKYSYVKDKIAEQFQRLSELFAREDGAIDLMRKSNYTAKIAAADQRLDRAVQSLGGILRTARNHFNPAVADAGQSLFNLFKSFGDIPSKSYREEMAAVTNLLQELHGGYADKITLIEGLDGWITEMEAAKTELTTLLDSRASEKAVRPQERMLNIRREIDAVYRELIARIEAFILVEGEPEYAAFIRELNTLIDEVKKIRPHHRKKKETEGEK
jgi:hypothetical protein